MTPKHCYIQLTPLPKVPSDETTAERNKRQAWFRKEVEDFQRWAGISDKEGTINIADGFPTKFLIQCSYNPQNSEEPWDKALDYFISSLFSACVYGDRGSTVDGQSFNGRARWKKKIKGSWSKKSKMSISLGGGRSLTQVAEYPPRPTYSGNTSDKWAVLILGGAVFVPVIAVVIAILGK